MYHCPNSVLGHFFKEFVGVHNEINIHCNPRLLKNHFSKKCVRVSKIDIKVKLEENASSSSVAVRSLDSCLMLRKISEQSLGVCCPRILALKHEDTYLIGWQRDSSCLWHLSSNRVFNVILNEWHVH